MLYLIITIYFDVSCHASVISPYLFWYHVHKGHRRLWPPTLYCLWLLPIIVSHLDQALKRANLRYLIDQAPPLTQALDQAPRLFYSFGKMLFLNLRLQIMFLVLPKLELSAPFRLNAA